MEWTAWQLWVLLALALWILEILVSGMIAACVGVAALGGALAAALAASLEWQLITAAFSGLSSYFFLRPLALKRWFGGEGLATNAQGLVGATVQVSSPFDASTSLGRCRIDGDDWRALWAPVDPNSPLPVLGEKVRVLRVDSATLIVSELSVPPTQQPGIHS